MRLKVRVKRILQDVIANTDASRMPIPLLTFLGGLVKPQSTIPDGFLTEFELNRIPIDTYGRMGFLNQDQVKMIASMFLLGKVLVVKILMSPAKLGMTLRLSEQALLNFKLLTSIFYHSYLEFTETMMARHVN